MSASARNGQGAAGSLIGLGGAEFRLPVLVGVFRLGTLEAIIFKSGLRHQELPARTSRGANADGK